MLAEGRKNELYDYGSSSYNRAGGITATITNGGASDKVRFTLIVIEKPKSGDDFDPDEPEPTDPGTYKPHPTSQPPATGVPEETSAGDIKWQNPYTDVNEPDWFYEFIKYVTENGIMVGTGDNKFSPNMAITRAMFVQTLYNYVGKPAVMGNSPFIDVDAGNWYTDAIIWAANEGIVSGFGDGLFGPNALITREQMVVILYNYRKSRGYGTDIAGDLSAYSDIDQISDWALPAIQWAVTEEIIKGRSLTTIVPNRRRVICTYRI